MEKRDVVVRVEMAPEQAELLLKIMRFVDPHEFFSHELVNAVRRGQQIALASPPAAEECEQ